MTPAEVYSIVRDQCAESSTEFWNESEIYNLMSIGENIIAQRIGLIETSTVLTTVTNTKTYSIVTSAGSGVGPLTRVTYDSYKLQAVEINEFDDIEGKAYGGVTVIGQPEYYYRYGDTLGLSPTPDEAKTVRLYHRANPPVVTTGSSSFAIPVEYTQYICDYALYRMMLKDQELRSEAIAYKNQWEENIAIIQSNWRKTKLRDRVPTVQIYDPLVGEYD